jgi:hypothetical protein
MLERLLAIQTFDDNLTFNKVKSSLLMKKENFDASYHVWLYHDPK